MPEKINKRRKYTLNLEPFFEETAEKYYWLGLLATDGNVALNEPRIRIELKADDVETLERLAIFCQTNKPIVYRVNNMNTQCARLDINSAVLKRYLANYNIVPAKSKTFTIPIDQIPNKFLWDFVRGMMDGDGCITLLQRKISNPYGLAFVSANYDCVKQMREIWGLPETHAISKTNGSYQLYKCGIGSLSIMDKIYENSTETTRMKRKYDRYRSLTE